MEPMETEPTRRVQSGCSVGRIVNLLLAFHFLLIMITALVVVGVMGALDLLVSESNESLIVCLLVGMCPYCITCKLMQYSPAIQEA